MKTWINRARAVWNSSDRLQDYCQVGVLVLAAAANFVWIAVVDNPFIPLNWLAAGFCCGAASYQVRINRQRQTIRMLSSDLHALSTATSPEQMRWIMQCALTAVVDQMKRDGALPPDTIVEIDPSKTQNSLH